MNIQEIVDLYKFTKQKKFPDYITIFTDGSKTPDKTSCALWMPSLDIEASFTLNKNCSILSAEAHTFLEAYKKM